RTAVVVGEVRQGGLRAARSFQLVEPIANLPQEFLSAGRTAGRELDHCLVELEQIGVGPTRLQLRRRCRRGGVKLVRIIGRMNALDSLRMRCAAGESGN